MPSPNHASVFIVIFIFGAICAEISENDLNCVTQCTELIGYQDRSAKVKGLCMHDPVLSRCVVSKCQGREIQLVCHLSNECDEMLKVLGDGIMDADPTVTELCRLFVQSPMCVYNLILILPEITTQMKSDLLDQKQAISHTGSKKCVDITNAMVMFADNKIDQRQFRDRMERLGNENERPTYIWATDIVSSIFRKIFEFQ